MAERYLDPALKQSLINGDEYSYFHLVKFEKPKSTVGSGKATDYAYITDSYINVSFDDLSRDSRNNLNGTQTYIANKLISVGTVNETTEARASNMSLTLSGTALGTIVQANVAFTSSSMSADIDLLEAGFQEGDILLLERPGGVNNNKYVRINTFTNNNQAVALTPIDTILNENGTFEEYNLSFASEEVSSLILSKESTNYSNYINREAYIYRAHMNPETGAIIGAPFLIFRGIISTGSVSDNMLQSSKVVWGLTSHWGDFVRVQGRQTSDSSHRALNTAGEPDIGALIRPEYAQDLGFMHAENSVNVLATYQSLETKMRTRRRGGFAGWMGGQKTIEYQELVDREVDLTFNLTAKYLPVIYGVQKVSTFPVFADAVLGTNSSKVYVVHAISEGEIGGIFDIHIENETLVCFDESDRLARESGIGNTTSTSCFGRADKGYVLSGSEYILNSLYNDYGTQFFDPSQIQFGVNSYIPAVQAILSLQGGSSGITHEKKTFVDSLDSGDATLIIHTGKSYQRADADLMQQAQGNKFVIQKSYYPTSSNYYWNNSHTLLDTAYTTAIYNIKDGETTIPEIEFVVRGKVLDCYNYDYSYESSNVQTDHQYFLLGDTVTLYTMSGTSLGDVTIIDKWYYYDTAGLEHYRFRFSENPQVTAGETAFYMQKGSYIWYMNTYNHKYADKAIFGTQPSVSITNIVKQNQYLLLYVNPTEPTIPTALHVGNRQVAITFDGVAPTSSYSTFTYYTDGGNKILKVIDSGMGTNQILENITRDKACTVKWLDVVTLNPADTAATNFYDGKSLVVTRYDSNDVITNEYAIDIQTYDSVTQQAILSSPLPISDVINTVTDRYTISSEGDKRISINPAIQLLDYLTSNRYGKGLKHTDLNIDTFLASARLCDLQSDVTVQVPGSLLNTSSDVGSIYKYDVGGVLAFRGTIKSIVPRQVYVSGVLTNFQEVTFTDVIGKLAYKWNNWRAFTANYPIWHSGALYLATGAVQTTAPTSGALTALEVTKTTGTGPATIPLSITDGYTASGNPLIKKYTNSTEAFNSPGYSLYDSDDVKYWKYLGWDSHDQRFATRHQMNQVIDTSAPLFDNINSMLIQFNGILRYSAGKYELGIRTGAPVSFESYQSISEDAILGELKVGDKGIKNTYNSVETAVIDPQNKFSGRSIKFFNSDYLKQDKGVRKSGNFALPGISNYYNARINIQQYLDESRFGLDVSFTTDSKGYLLLAGEIIQLTYKRFGWENKLFRIDNLNFQSNGLVQVTATEHNENAFLVKYITSSASNAIADSSGGAINQNPIATPVSPSNLTATTGGKGAIDLTWNNSSTFSFVTHNTEVWSSNTNDRTAASLIYTTQATTMSHIISEQSEVTKYYWVKHTVITSSGLVVASNYFPESSTGGIVGSATGAIDGEAGPRGAGRWHIQVSVLPTTSGEANTAYNTGSGNQPDAAVLDDQAWFYTGTLSNPTGQSVWIYEGAGVWNKQEEVIDGDLIVAGTITATQINAEVGNFGQLVADIGTFTTLDTDTLDANSIIAREIQVFPEGGTAPTISGTTLAGAGIDLKQDGDLYVGDVSAEKYIFWDQSEGTLTLRGSLNAGDISAGFISADRIDADTITADKISANAITAEKIAADAITADKIDVVDLSAISADIGAISAGTLQNSGANAIPDADSAPSGAETGAFIDLDAGKFVFGSAAKHILWDGTDLILSGVSIDAQSTIDAIAGVIIQEDGTTEAAAANTLNFTSGINVEVVGDVATISAEAQSNDYVDSLTFAAATGVLTAGRTGALADLTVNLDGRYLTSFTETDPIYLASTWYTTTNNSANWDTAYGWGNHASAGYLTSFTEADTLDSVTGRGNTTTNSITVNDMTVSGNLTVSGTTTTINTEQINLADNIINLNSNLAVETAPTENAGISINRGNEASVSLLWDETNNRWTFTNNGSSYFNIPISTEYDNYTHWGISDGSNTGTLTSQQSLIFTGTGDTSVSYNNATKTLTVSSTNTVYSPGDLLDLSGTTFNVDLSELTDMTEALVSTDELVLLDGGIQKRKQVSEIDLNLFNTSNLTAASANLLGGQPSSYYLSTDTVFSGDVTGTWNALSITGYNNTNWDTAYGWGNHASAGYLTTYTNNYVNSVAFATSTGILTLGRAGLGDLTIDLDGRYLTSYTLPKATDTVLGGIELFSATVQTIVANTVSTTAGKTYGIQLNAADQAVVNVPWSDTNTTYTAGTGLQLSGTVFSTSGNLNTIASATITNLTVDFLSADVIVANKITTNSLTLNKLATAPVAGEGSVEIGNAGIRILDSSNVLRVAIGNLSRLATDKNLP